MDELRDYFDWHREYDDPTSGISWRLTVVRRCLHHALDHSPGPVSVLSLCAGDGRDVIGVLAERSDAARVRATLVELHPDLASAARSAADRAGLGTQVEVRTAAGLTELAYEALPDRDRPAFGAFRFDGPPRPLPGPPLFTFIR